MSTIREKILAAQDIRKETVYIPEWDVTVEVRTLTGEQRALARRGAVEVEKKFDPAINEMVEVQVQNEAKLSAALIIAGTFDPQSGEPVFTAVDRDALMQKSASVLDQLVLASARVSGLTVAEQKVMEKNSEATPNAVSTSA